MRGGSANGEFIRGDQYYCQNPETLLISSRFYWVSDIFGKIGNSIG